MSRVDEVRAAADIVKIVGEHVKLRKGGVNLVGLCPFHQEKTPSFAVHPVKQIFHCFGCGVGGDVFKFVMLIEHLSFPEALRRVAEKAGMAIAGGGFDEGKYDAGARERAALHKIHELAAKFYAAQLSGTAEGRAARSYLADRGLTDEVVGRFRLGYAPADGQGLTRHLSGAELEAEAVEKSGLLLRDAEGQRHFDRFRRRVIFPIASESGKVVAFGGRALGDDLPKYLNSPETPIYTKGRVLYNLDRAAAAVRKQDYAILVEGYMDCIAVASSGIENVVASCGTSLTESQIRLLGRSSRRVVVNYDPDAAGVAATERSLALLLEAGFEVKVLALPGGLDPDSFIRKRGAAAYREALSAAPTYLDYLTERAAAQHDLSRPEGKVAAANAVLPYLVRTPSPMLRVELAARLAERLRLDGRLLREELKRVASEGRRETELRPEVTALPATPAEKALLKAFLESPELADEFLPGLVEEGTVEGLTTERVFKLIVEARRRGERVEVAGLDDSLRPEEQRLVYESFFWPEKTPDREWVVDACRALGRKKADREREQLQSAIQATGDLQEQIRLGQAKLEREMARRLSQVPPKG